MKEKEERLIIHFTTNLSGGGAETQMLLLADNLKDFESVVVYNSAYESFPFAKYPQIEFLTFKEFRKNRSAFKTQAIYHIWIPDVFMFVNPFFFIRRRERLLVGVRNRYTFLFGWASTAFKSDSNATVLARFKTLAHNTFLGVKRFCQWLCILPVKHYVANSRIEMHHPLYRPLYRAAAYHFIPNAVRYSFQEIPNRAAETERSNRFLYAGRLVSKKGIHILLKSLKNLEKKRYTMDVVGRGPLETSVEIFEQRKHSAESTFCYHGYQQEPLPFFSRTDFLILPSFVEGMPNVAFEALSQNCVLILSDIPQHKAWFTDNDVIFFKVGNSVDLTRAIKEAIEMSNEDYHKKLVSSRDVLSQMTVENYVSAYKKLYSNLIDK